MQHNFFYLLNGSRLEEMLSDIVFHRVKMATKVPLMVHLIMK